MPAHPLGRWCDVCQREHAAIKDRLSEFYEDDEPVSDLLAAFATATECGKTALPRQ